MENLKLAIAYQIQEYLAGHIRLEDVREWAWDILENDEPGIEPSQDISYWIIQDGLWRIIMLDPPEPEDYRTTREDLQVSLAYLKGETPFPEDRIPQASLKELRQTMAKRIEDYLAGSVPLISLVAWAASCDGYLQDLLRPEPRASQIIRHAIDIIRRIDPSGAHPDRPSRAEVWLAVSYLRGTVTFSVGPDS